MNRVRTLLQALCLVAALAFAVTTVAVPANAEGAATGSWCEENYPGNPQCIDEPYYRNTHPEEGCVDAGCPTWLQICCLEPE